MCKCLIQIIVIHRSRSQYIGCSLKKGFQYIAIGHQDMSRRNILRPIFHTLGRRNEHTRTDRDFYVNIQWANIRPCKFHCIRKYGNISYVRMGQVQNGILYSKYNFATTKAKALQSIYTQKPFTFLL